MISKCQFQQTSFSLDGMYDGMSTSDTSSIVFPSPIYQFGEDIIDVSTSSKSKSTITPLSLLKDNDMWSNQILLAAENDSFVEYINIDVDTSLEYFPSASKSKDTYSVSSVCVLASIHLNNSDFSPYYSVISRCEDPDDLSDLSSFPSLPTHDCVLTSEGYGSQTASLRLWGIEPGKKIVFMCQASSIPSTSNGYFKIDITAKSGILTSYSIFEADLLSSMTTLSLSTLSYNILNIPSVYSAALNFISIQTLSGDDSILISVFESDETIILPTLHSSGVAILPTLRNISSSTNFSTYSESYSPTTSYYNQYAAPNIYIQDFASPLFLDDVIEEISTEIYGTNTNSGTYRLNISTNPTYLPPLSPSSSILVQSLSGSALDLVLSWNNGVSSSIGGHVTSNIGGNAIYSYDSSFLPDSPIIDISTLQSYSTCLKSIIPSYCEQLVDITDDISDPNSDAFKLYSPSLHFMTSLPPTSSFSSSIGAVHSLSFTTSLLPPSSLFSGTLSPSIGHPSSLLWNKGQDKFNIGAASLSYSGISNNLYFSTVHSHSMTYTSGISSAYGNGRFDGSISPSISYPIIPTSFVSHCSASDTSRLSVARYTVDGISDYSKEIGFHATVQSALDNENSISIENYQTLIGNVQDDLSALWFDGINLHEDVIGVFGEGKLLNNCECSSSSGAYSCSCSAPPGWSAIPIHGGSSSVALSVNAKDDSSDSEYNVDDMTYLDPIYYIGCTSRQADSVGINHNIESFDFSQLKSFSESISGYPSFDAPTPMIIDSTMSDISVSLSPSCSFLNFYNPGSNSISFSVLDSPWNFPSILQREVQTHVIWPWWLALVVLVGIVLFGLLCGVFCGCCMCASSRRAWKRFKKTRKAKKEGKEPEEKAPNPFTTEQARSPLGSPLGAPTMMRSSVMSSPYRESPFETFDY
ncbi:hypothetical protein ADUPG1_013932 [Aduncisulcus paluster]|uniref:Uncharacterized protein n=1 Tax=Aduncisulcus paluster TaxID=2918883 RepID=A0ABQ5K4V7_9EUKA|nr:hypothetical protein ADUPG1_013932 [Aduncisulcus paluster]